MAPSSSSGGLDVDLPALLVHRNANDVTDGGRLLETDLKRDKLDVAETE